MIYSNAFSESIRELEKDRGNADWLLDSRKNEIYEKIPRIKEIDEKLMQTGINLAKLVLSGTNEENIDKVISRMEKENDKLSREKKVLLKESGYKNNFLTDVYKCKTCSDTGFVDNEKCRCLKQKLIDKYYKISNLGNILKKENFDHFDIRLYSDEIDPEEGLSPKTNIQQIHKVCREFIIDFNTKPTNLLFYGSPGLGKTFLCNSIAKDLLDAGRAVLYVTAAQLFIVFDNHRFHREEMAEPDAMMELMLITDLLIIDDLGTEMPTLSSLSDFFNVINYRILEAKPMIISTNLMPEEFEMVYTERIMSRFMGSFTMLKFFGDDIRFEKKYLSKNKKNG